MKTTRIARVTGWLLLVAAVFLTLGPPRLRPVTGLDHNLEHFLAFALLGLMFGLGYGGRRLVMAPIGVTMAALLETFQLWVPGRHASFSDFVVNSIGLCGGLIAARLLQWMTRRQQA